MNSAVRYGSKTFGKALKQTQITKSIHDAFSDLEQEIKKLSPVQQIQLYLAAAQLLETLQRNGRDTIHPLEVFSIQCHAIVRQERALLQPIVLGLGVLAIGLCVVGLGLGLGIGIGLLAGLWNTSMAFFAAAAAFEAAPIALVSSSVLAGGIAGALSHWMFFKEPKVTTSINQCVEAVKESYLLESEEEAEAANDAGVFEQEADASDGISIASVR